MQLAATKAEIRGRGIPPTSFLVEQISWLKSASQELWEPNSEKDIFSLIKPYVGPQGNWTDLADRQACLAEVMRVHAGEESSWKWNEGVDTNNEESLTHITGEETGIFQVSFDSEWLNPSLRIFLVSKNIHTPQQFIDEMKSDHQLAMEYYVRLIRHNYEWAGPLKSNIVSDLLNDDAIYEYKKLLCP